MSVGMLDCLTCQCVVDFFWKLLFSQHRVMLKCLMNMIVKKECADKVVPMKEVFKEYSGNFMNELCGEYDDARCAQMPPLPDVKLESKGNYLRNLVEIFESIHDN